jgi:hypothetical protein
VNENVSAAFMSWAAFHICEMKALLQQLEKEHRLWPGIAVTMQQLEASTQLLSRVTQSL